jgi:hypothetical protein
MIQYSVLLLRALRAFHLSARKPLERYHPALQGCDAYFVGSEPGVEAERVEALRETVARLGSQQKACRHWMLKAGREL